MKQTLFPHLPVLLVDDEQQFLFSEGVTLRSAGITNLTECCDSREVIPLLGDRGAAVVVLDMMMPHIEGYALLEAIVRDFPEIPVIVVTAINEVDTAVNAMKTGAFDYLVKPVDESRLVSSVRRAVELSEIRNENAVLKHYLLSGALQHPEAFREITTQDRGMRSLFQYAEAIGKTSLPILITGETGVGKELFARAIHTISGRPGPFVQVNAGGVDDNFFSDTLFGHKRGAFTGAEAERKGFIDQASAGTLFLDEIGDLAAESQVRLLRVLQNGTYYPLGSDMERTTDARFVVATNKDIDAAQMTGTFRKDLYYRLKAHRIHLPPLRERRGDIPLLVDHFLEKAALSLHKKKPTPPGQLMTLLSTYHFPGNVRELEGMVFDAVSQHMGRVLSMKSFQAATGMGPVRGGLTGQEKPLHASQQPRIAYADQLPTLHEMEEDLIAEALRRSDGNQTIASAILGISRQAFNNRLRRLRK